jgi:hypothetical protein
MEMKKNLSNLSPTQPATESRKAGKKVPESITDKIARAILYWILLCGTLTFVFCLLGICVASIWTAAIGLNIAWAYIVYHDAKRRGRKEVAWATTFVVFGVLLAGILYLLTWPSSTNKGGNLQ